MAHIGCNITDGSSSTPCNSPSNWKRTALLYHSSPILFVLRKRSATQIKVICDIVQQFSDANVCNMDHMDNSGKVSTAETIFLSALCCSLVRVIRIMYINVVS